MQINSLGSKVQISAHAYPVSFPRGFLAMADPEGYVLVCIHKHLGAVKTQYDVGVLLSIFKTCFFTSAGSRNFRPSLKRCSSGERSWTKSGRPGRLLGMQHERYGITCKNELVGLVKCKGLVELLRNLVYQ